MYNEYSNTFILCVNFVGAWLHSRLYHRLALTSRGSATRQGDGARGSTFSTIQKKDITLGKNINNRTS